MKKNIVYLFTLFICCSCIQSVTSSQHTTKKIVNKTEKEFFYEVYTDVGNKSVFVHPLDNIQELKIKLEYFLKVKRKKMLKKESKL